MKILGWLLFFGTAIAVIVVAVHWADDMWTSRCQEQYGEQAVRAPDNGVCIIEDGTLRYLR